MPQQSNKSGTTATNASATSTARIPVPAGKGAAGSRPSEREFDRSESSTVGARPVGTAGNGQYNGTGTGVVTGKWPGPTELTKEQKTQLSQIGKNKPEGSKW